MKSLDRVRLGERRDWRSPALGPEDSCFIGSDEHDSARDVWPTLLDTSIQLVAIHAWHSEVAEDHIVAPASE
jgi:hypothetical protein